MANSGEECGCNPVRRRFGNREIGDQFLAVDPAWTARIRTWSRKTLAVDSCANGLD
jgi:hypothetical protein